MQSSSSYTQKPFPTIAEIVDRLCAIEEYLSRVSEQLEEEEIDDEVLTEPEN